MKPNPSKKVDMKQIRCAIYTRKSTEEGLQQEFNTVDAQREAGEAFIAAQKHEGWVCLPDRYDDGGFTGGNLERPAVKRMMADIVSGKIDCVVVYKVDRLSRSLMDFSRMMETFDKQNVSFVSVTQQFNTTHSMGRLTLNILLSFAQFEREIISERTRDKIAAARRKGKFAGGRPVLGYDILSNPTGPKLIINPDEAERIKAIFALYLKHQGMIPPDLKEFLNQPHYNIAPSQHVPIIRPDKDDQPSASLVQWGLIPSWTIGKPKLKPINARCETVGTSPMFRSALERRRCIVPVDGFYEWQGAKPPKQPFFIHMKDDAPFAFAGLWERWKPDEEAEAIDTFTIVTTTPNEVMKPLHNRMPVILDESDYGRWLDRENKAADVADLLKPFEADRMEAWPVSTRVNKPGNQGAELIAKV